MSGRRLPVGALVALATGSLLVSTWSDAVQVADSAELVAAACNRGVPHPPGSPLYVLVGNVFCRLPLSTPAGRVALLSVLCGVIAALLVYLIGWRLTGNRWAAAVGALALVTGSTTWRNCSLANVRAPLVALALATVYCALRATRARTARHQLLLVGASGLCGGLALSTHLTAVAVAPVALAAVLLPWRSAAQAGARLVVGLLGLLVGLTPYLSLLGADPAVLPYWGATQSWQGLWHHFLRRDYGALGAAAVAPGHAFESLTHYLAALPTQLGWLLFPLSLFGLGLLCWRALRPVAGEADAPGRGFGAGLALAVLLAGPAFLLLMKTEAILGRAGPEGIGAQVLARFHPLPNALLAICLAVGLAQVDRRWLAGATQARQRLWRVAGVLVLGVVAIEAYPRADVSESYAVEDWATNALASAAPDALVLGTGDVQLFSMIYAKHVLGRRPDVQYVDVRMLLYPWYVAQIRRLRPDFPYRFRAGHVDSIGMIQRALDAEIPVYLASIYNDKVARAFPLHPEGALLRVLIPSDPPPLTRRLVELNRDLYRRFARRGRLPDPAVDPWSALLMADLARTWRNLAEVQRSGGDLEGARQSLARAGRWAPWLGAPAWASGEATR